jgi:hypothetical protein
VNVKLNVPDVLIVSDARVEPVSLVTVCGALESLVHTTFVPVATVSMAGSNPYCPLCVVIFTWAVAVDAVVAVGAVVALGAVVAVGAVGALVAPALVPLVAPHPERSRMTRSMAPGHQ